MRNFIITLIAGLLVSGTAHMHVISLVWPARRRFCHLRQLLQKKWAKIRISKHPLLNQAVRLLVKKVYVMDSVQSLSILEMHHLV